jgi:hypothetical protein
MEWPLWLITTYKHVQGWTARRFTGLLSGLFCQCASPSPIAWGLRNWELGMLRPLRPCVLSGFWCLFSSSWAFVPLFVMLCLRYPSAVLLKRVLPIWLCSCCQTLQQKKWLVVIAVTVGSASTRGAVTLHLGILLHWFLRLHTCCRLQYNFIYTLL